MSDNRSQTPAEPRPTLLLCCTIIGVIAVLSVMAAVILTALDANAVPDLPDPLVNNVGDLAASASVVTVILLGIHILRRAGSRNTAAVMAVSGALKEDTDEIPNLARLMRNPHVVVVRDPGPFDKLDRDTAMRVTADAELRSAPVTGHRPPDEMSAEEWRIYLSGYNDRRARGDGPDPVA